MALNVRGFSKFLSYTKTPGSNGPPLGVSRLSYAGGGRLNRIVALDPNNVCPIEPFVLRALARFKPGIRA